MYESPVDKITTKMEEYVCDSLCKYPDKVHGEDALNKICDVCKMSKFVCDILNEYNNVKYNAK